MAKLKKTEDWMKTLDNQVECKKLYEEYLKKKDIKGLKKELVRIYEEARIAYDLVEFLFINLMQKGILDKEAYDRALYISAFATKEELLVMTGKKTEKQSRKETQESMKKIRKLIKKKK